MQRWIGRGALGALLTIMCWVTLTMATQTRHLSHQVQQLQQTVRVLQHNQEPDIAITQILVKLTDLHNRGPWVIHGLYPRAINFDRLDQSPTGGYTQIYFKANTPAQQNYLKRFREGQVVSIEPRYPTPLPQPISNLDLAAIDILAPSVTRYYQLYGDKKSPITMPNPVHLL